MSIVDFLWAYRGDIFWLLMMAAVLWWAYDYLRGYGKQPEVKAETNGTWRDCRHGGGLIEHFLGPWFLSAPTCCAQSGRFRCQLGPFHKGQHWGTLPEDDHAG